MIVFRLVDSLSQMVLALPVDDTMGRFVLTSTGAEVGIPPIAARYAQGTLALLAVMVAEVPDVVLPQIQAVRPVLMSTLMWLQARSPPSELGVLVRFLLSTITTPVVAGAGAGVGVGAGVGTPMDVERVVPSSPTQGGQSLERGRGANRVRLMVPPSP